MPQEKSFRSAAEHRTVLLVADGESTLDLLRPLDLVEDRDGEVLVGDPAPARGVEQELIAADAEAACTLARNDLH